MRDVALMPEGYVFERDLSIAAHHAREAEMFSQVMGLRLWGMALEPFCLAEKNSSASRTSVRWRWRISVAILSSDDARTARVVM